MEPLQQLMKKNKTWSWTEREEQAFNRLKNALINFPILKLPLPDQAYVLQTDASDIVIGAVLSQIQDNVEHPIAYASRTLNNAE